MSEPLCDGDVPVHDCLSWAGRKLDVEQSQVECSVPPDVALVVPTVIRKAREDDSRVDESPDVLIHDAYTQYGNVHERETDEDRVPKKLWLEELVEGENVGQSEQSNENDE